MNPFRIRKSRGEEPLFFPLECRRPSSASLLPSSFAPSIFRPVPSENPRFRIRTGGESSSKMKPFREKFAVLFDTAPPPSPLALHATRLSIFRDGGYFIAHRWRRIFVGYIKCVTCICGMSREYLKGTSGNSLHVEVERSHCRRLNY